MTRVVGYLRCSTDEQRLSGAGLDAQRAAITSYSCERGWELHAVYADEAVSGSVAPDDRWGWQQALADLADRPRRTPPGVLIVARIDRLARKASDLLKLRDAAEQGGWALASADGSVDLTTPHGRAMFTTQGAFAELERDLIRQRTREALAARKAAGVRLGRPRQMPAATAARVLALRAQGLTLAAVAEQLTAEGVPTVRGGSRWYSSSVHSTLASAALDALAQPVVA